MIKSKKIGKTKRGEEEKIKMTNKKDNPIGENKGITLIALVITVIVLLILAGVSIAMLTGDNGVLTKAVEAKEKTQKADLIERLQTDLLGMQIENMEGITKKEFKDVLDKYFEKVPEVEELPDNLKETQLKLKAKKEYGGQEIEIGEIYSGELEVPKETAETLKDKLKDTNGDSVIGKKVTGLVGEGNTEAAKNYEWQIFDIEGDNIYLIAADYITLADCPSKNRKDST